MLLIEEKHRKNRKREGGTRQKRNISFSNNIFAPLLRATISEFVDFVFFVQF